MGGGIFFGGEVKSKKAAWQVRGAEQSAKVRRVTGNRVLIFLWLRVGLTLLIFFEEY